MRADSEPNFRKITKKFRPKNLRGNSKEGPQRLVDATCDRERDLSDSDSDSSPPTPPHAPHLSGQLHL